MQGGHCCLGDGAPLGISQEVFQTCKLQRVLHMLLHNTHSSSCYHLTFLHGCCQLRRSQQSDSYLGYLVDQFSACHVLRLAPGLEALWLCSNPACKLVSFSSLFVRAQRHSMWFQSSIHKHGRNYLCNNGKSWSRDFCYAAGDVRGRLLLMLGSVMTGDESWQTITLSCLCE